MIVGAIISALRKMLSRSSLIATTGIASVVACTNIDCRLNNTVYATYSLYDSSTDSVLTLTDTLTVTAFGTDSVLYNKGISLSSLTLPMSYTGSADTLLFTWTDTNSNSGTDTLIVSHTNRVHFESLDCNTVVFHTVTSTSINNSSVAASPMRIDSIVVVNPEIDYNGNENFRLYLSAQ